MVKMLESKAVELVEDPEPEPKVDDKPELEVAKLVSLQRGLPTANGSCRATY